MADKVLGRAILGKRLAKRTRVPIEEWGGEVLIRQITEAELYRIQEVAGVAVVDGQVRDRTALWHFNFELIRACWITEDGEPVLTPEDEQDLHQESHAALETLVQAISELNRLMPDAVVSAEKNSVVTTSNGSGSS